MKKHLQKIKSGCFMCAGPKLKLLEDFYGIDYILLGDSYNDLSIDNNTKNEYLLAKSSLLSVTVEMMKELDYSVMLEDKLTNSSVKEDIVIRAINARKRTKGLMTTPKFKKIVTEEAISEDEVLRRIRKWSLQISLNELLLPDLFDTGLLEKGSTFKYVILEREYLAKRNSLVSLAEIILDSNE